MEKNIEILANREELIDRALEILLAKITEAIETRNQFTIALAGGSTPKPLYEALAQQPLPWDKIHVFWGDERYVEPDHPDSNQKMAAQAWLDRVNFPATNIHPMPTLAKNPVADAEQYNRELVQFFALNAGELYYIEDVGSSNGTYINNTALPKGNRHRLKPGDRISLGKGDLVSFIFQLSKG